MPQRKSFRIAYWNCWAGSCGIETFRLLLALARDNHYLGLQEIHRWEPERPFMDRPQPIHAVDRGHRTGPINPTLFNDLVKAMSELATCTFAPHLSGLHDMEANQHSVQFGNATCIKNTVAVEAASYRIYHGWLNKPTCRESPAARSGMITVCSYEGHVYVIGNVHGVWWHGDKGDVHFRRVQLLAHLDDMRREVKRIKFESDRTARVVFGGDFNLKSNTETMQAVLDHPVFRGGGVNLLAAAGNTDTRTKHYPDGKSSREADYIIVSDALARHCTIHIDREVPSDHALLELSIAA